MYPPDRSDLISIPNGIAARGDFGVRWWSRKFMDAIEASEDASSDRFAQGMDYARLGQALRLDIGAGIIRATVQGARHTPYEVEIHIRLFSDDEWHKAGTVLASRAVFLAQLLSGEMPPDIAQAFDAVGLPLFPVPDRLDFVGSCTCPENVKLCKHIACVCYLLAERLDEDPFILFGLRGRDRDKILSDLRDLRPVAPAAHQMESAIPTVAVAVEPAVETRTYWQSLPALSEEHVPSVIGQGDVFLRELDPALRVQVESDLWDTLSSVYEAASNSARALLDNEQTNEH
jgi:uncharacterized Zn finger protein